MGMRFKYQGVGDRGIPLTLKEIVLIHLENLSDEIVKDGVAKQFEPALDRLMNWLFWEFTEHHKEDRIRWKGQELTYPEVFNIVMTRDFGNTKISDKERAERIQDKERLLSLLLAEHRITLGKVDSYEEAALPADIRDIIPDEEEDLPNGSDAEDSP